MLLNRTLSLLCWVLALLVHGAQAAPASLRVCMSDVAHVPWRMPRADTLVHGEGLDFALIRDFERVSGRKVTLLILSGRRCFVEMQLGRADATVGLSYTPERTLFLRYPMLDGKPNVALALRFDAYVLYRRPDAAVSWDGQQLRLPAGAKVGVQAGHSVAQWLRDAGHTVDERWRNADEVLRAVADGELQAAALLVGEGEALRRGDAAFAALQRVEPPLITKPYFVVFSSQFAQANEGSLPTLWRQFATAAQRNPAYQQAARLNPRSP